jgi:hypothetical protein
MNMREGFVVPGFATEGKLGQSQIVKVPAKLD